MIWQAIVEREQDCSRVEGITCTGQQSSATDVKQGTHTKEAWGRKSMQVSCGAHHTHIGAQDHGLLPIQPGAA
jgi:hypothetical protein